MDIEALTLVDIELDTSDKADMRDWLDGPWKVEADFATWQDPETGALCMILRNSVGALCGYAAISKSHPLYGLDMLKAGDHVSVWGGVTWSNLSPSPRGIKGDYQDGQPLWWIGFDCSHCNDYMPAMGRQFPIAAGRVKDYKTIDFVFDEVSKLAKQLHEMESKNEEL